MVWGCSVSSSFPSCCGIGALQLGQVALRGLLRAAHQHEQFVGALLAEGVDQQAAGVVQAAVDHEVLGLQQPPELLQNFGGHLRRDAAQVGQLFGEPLHVDLRQGAQNLLGQFFSHRNEQDRGLAHPGHVHRGRWRRSAPFVFACSSKLQVLSLAN